MTDSEQYGVTITVKGGTGYDEPWVVFREASGSDALASVATFAGMGGFGAVRGAAAEFHGARGDGAQIVADAFPGSRWDDPPAQRSTAPASVPAPQTASGYQPQPYSVNPGQAYEQGQPQASINPPCPTCSAVTKFRSGNGQKGPWSGYFCVATESMPQGQKHKPIWL